MFHDFERSSLEIANAIAVLQLESTSKRLFCLIAHDLSEIASSDSRKPDALSWSLLIFGRQNELNLVRAGRLS